MDMKYQLNSRLFIVPSLLPKSQTTLDMPGWFRVAQLSNDGNILVVGNPGNNLISRDYQEDDVLLTFYKHGLKIAKYTIKDLIVDLGQLKPTVSHYEWGEYLGFDEEGHYIVQTVEHRIINSS